MSTNDFRSDGKYSDEGLGLLNGTANIRISAVSDTGRCVVGIQASAGADTAAPLGVHDTYTDALQAVQELINELNA